MFVDRSEAGRRLGHKLAGLDLPDPVLYALPRGGVPVAAEIAAILHAPLDLLLVRKLGAPGQPELAIGAIVDADPPVRVLNEDIVRQLHVPAGVIERIEAQERAEIVRRRALYLAGRAPLAPRGRSAIVVDDGLATGATARAALRALRTQGPACLVLAVPVAPAEVLADMTDEADAVVCLETPADFPGVGAFYRDFHQVPDAEVLRLLRAGA